MPTHRSARARYELFYWPSIPGRGEFVRLALEDAGVPYVDVARLPKKDGGVDAMFPFMRGAKDGARPFAPPFLRAGKLVIAHTAHILAYLGPRHGLAPTAEAGDLEARQHQLTIMDLVVEAHDTHHPVGTNLYYEDQKKEAKRRTKSFIDARMPKFLGYFEELLRANKKSRGKWLVGSRCTYVDLSMFQMIEGLTYAFPKSFGRYAKKVPALMELRDRVRARPRMAAYLASERRIPFNEDGIFRHYPELDVR